MPEFHLSNIYIKKNVLLSIKMINLSLNELKLRPQLTNISDYENKSKKYLIKALSKPKPKTLKPETPKKHQKQNQKQHQNKH